MLGRILVDTMKQKNSHVLLEGQGSSPTINRVNDEQLAVLISVLETHFLPPTSTIGQMHTYDDFSMLRRIMSTNHTLCYLIPVLFSRILDRRDSISYVTK